MQYFPWNLLMCHGQPFRACISNCIPQFLWDVITYACLRYLFLWHKSSYIQGCDVLCFTVMAIDHKHHIYVMVTSQIAKFMGPTWGPPGSCWSQMGPMLALWTLLSGIFPSANEVILKHGCHQPVSKHN